MQWERDVPLDDIISIIDAEGLLGQYCYADIKGKDNMIEKRRTLVDYFLTKDERCIARLDAIVQAQGGFDHLKLDAPPPPHASPQVTRPIGRMWTRQILMTHRPDGIRCWQVSE